MAGECEKDNFRSAMATTKTKKEARSIHFRLGTLSLSARDTLPDETDGSPTSGVVSPGFERLCKGGSGGDNNDDDNDDDLSPSDCIEEGFTPPVRHRSNTLPENIFILPLIKVEDCSAEDLQSANEKGLCDIYDPPGGLVSLQRRRANTCPDIFEPKKGADRPATPPPCSASLLCSPARLRFSFSQQRLTKLSEEHKDTLIEDEQILECMASGPSTTHVSASQRGTGDNSGFHPI